MDCPQENPRQWATLTLTIAADTAAELDAALEEFADEAFLWAKQPVDEYLRHQREVHVWAKLGVPDWVECP